VGSFTVFEDGLAPPFETEILGVSATVEQIELIATGKIVAVCRRGRERQRIPILKLPLPTPAPAGAHWIEADRR
jgi:hypothetical protein